MSTIDHPRSKRRVVFFIYSSHIHNLRAHAERKVNNKKIVPRKLDRIDLFRYVFQQTYRGIENCAMYSNDVSSNLARVYENEIMKRAVGHVGSKVIWWCLFYIKIYTGLVHCNVHRHPHSAAIALQ